MSPETLVSPWGQKEHQKRLSPKKIVNPGDISKRVTLGIIYALGRIPLALTGYARVYDTNLPGGRTEMVLPMLIQFQLRPLRTAFFGKFLKSSPSRLHA